MVTRPRVEDSEVPRLRSHGLAAPLRLSCDFAMGSPSLTWGRANLGILDFGDEVKAPQFVNTIADDDHMI